MNIKPWTFYLCALLVAFPGSYLLSQNRPANGTERGERIANGMKTDQMEQVAMVCRVDTVDTVQDEHWETIFLSAKCDAKRYRIHVGPSWYVRNVNINVADVIDVLAFRNKHNRQHGPELVLARRIKKEGRELWLRNYNGMPLWEDYGRDNGDNRRGENRSMEKGKDGKGNRGMMPGGMSGMGGMNRTGGMH
jgi:hypothetical protein